MLRRRKATEGGGEPSPDIADWLAHDDTLSGGYVFTADPQAPLITLSAHITTHSRSFQVSVPPQELPAGQCYLLGGPDEPTCEVVQVEFAAPEPGEPRQIRRAMFDTVVMNHPAGTLVTPIAVERPHFARLPG
jgi:hypothetical protein